MRTFYIVALAGAAIILALTAPAQTHEQAGNAQHKIFLPQDIDWQAGPESLPPEIEHAVLYGDPAAEGQFVMRLRIPAGYQIPPHTHPKLESVTVISGALHLGMGETPDRGAAQALPAGSYFGMPPGMVHYAFTEEPTVIQLNSLGPWEINYINPADDPRS